MSTKNCTICKQDKCVSLFHKNKAQKDGLERRCKECRKSKAAASYKKDWFARVARLKKSFCKNNNIDFDLTEEDLKDIWTTHCPVFGKAFVMFDKSHDCSPALDRIDPGKGYIKGNVCFISARANRIKYNATIEELEKVIDYIKTRGV
jgi:hypothetical protein